LVVKEEVGPAIEVLEKMKPMLKEFQRIMMSFWMNCHP